MRTITLSLFVFLFLSGCTSVRPIPVKTTDHLRLFVFDCGSISVKDLSLFSPGVDVGKSKEFSDSCYLIQHPEGLLLWDSGLNDELAAHPEGVSARDGKLLMKQKTPLLAQLAKMGIKPEDIQKIAFSHFHSDHVGNANKFPEALLLIQEEEYQAAFGPEAETKYGFNPKFYNKLKNNPVKKLQGDYDVFNDGRVIIKRAVGHTPGHQALFVNLEKTGPILLSGDLYHFKKNREYKRVPGFNFDKQATLKSMDLIEEFVKDKHAQLWIPHDREQSKHLKKAPAYYE